MCGASFNQNTDILNISSLNESHAFADSGAISWSQVAPQPVANTEAQTVVVGNKMYVFGGYDKLKTTWTPTDRAYVFDPKANTWTPLASMPPTTAEDKVVMNFNITQARDYYIFARVKAPGDLDNSFWVRVDGGNWLKWHIGLTYDVFDWRTVRDGSFTFSTISPHTIDFAYREDGTLLDKIYITSTATLPTGMGGMAINCGDAAASLAGTAKYESEPIREQTRLFTTDPEADCLTCGQNGFTVFPNPGEGLFTVHISGEQINAGVYLLRLSTKKQTFVKRIEKL